MSHTPGCRKELSPRAGRTVRGLSSSELQSKLTARGAPEGGRGRQAAKERLRPWLWDFVRNTAIPQDAPF